MRALRLPAHASPVTYLLRFRGPRNSSSVRARCCQRSRTGWRSRVGPGSLFGRRSHLPAHSRVDASGTSQVPRRPILCLCLGLGPRPNRRSLAMAVSSMLPLLFRRQRLQHWSYRGYRGASAPAVYASRVMLPPPMQDSLPAGWLAFAGRELNPLGRDEKFQSCYILFPLSWIYPDATKLVSSAPCFT